MDIPVGSEWRDNDPRSHGRLVTVIEVNDHFVWYRFVVKCRSRRNRFVKAFTRVR